MHRYMKRKLYYGKQPNPVANWSKLVITKMIYVSMWIVLPILLTDIAWYKVLIGFFIMHYVAGLILSVVFQLAHIVPNNPSQESYCILSPEEPNSRLDLPDLEAPYAIRLVLNPSKIEFVILLTKSADTRSLEMVGPKNLDIS